MSKNKLMTRASALTIVSLAMVGAADAQSRIYSGGSSLTGKVLNQIENCYGNPSQALDIQGSLNGNPQFPIQYYSTPLNCIGSPALTQSVFNYDAVGPEDGIASLFSQFAARYAGIVYSTPQPTGPPAAYPQWDFAASEVALTLSDVGSYFYGGVLSKVDNVPLDGYGCTAAANIDLSSPYYDCHLAARSPNPYSSFGPLIQVPAAIVPIAIAYNPNYYSAWVVTKGVGKLINYAFRLRIPAGQKTPIEATLNGGITEPIGGLLLDMPTVCSIFNGDITSWSDPALTALNGGVSLRAAADKTNTFPNLIIELVGRQDSSGTTAIFNRALAAQCNSDVLPGYAGSNYYFAGGSTILAGQTWTVGTPPPQPLPGQFTVVASDTGIQAYLGIAPNTNTTVSNTVIQGKLAYLAPDFVLPAVSYADDQGPLTAATFASEPINFKLNVVAIKGIVATIKSGKTTYKAGAILPNAQTALAAFQNGGGLGSLPPQTDTTGAYAAGSTANGYRNAPSDWVQSDAINEWVSNGSGGSGVYQPTPLAYAVNVQGAYPIVGTSNIVAVTCYATSAVATTVADFLDFYEGGTPIAGGPNGVVVAQALVNYGFSPLPPQWNTAIINTFAADNDGLHLNISTPITATSGACVSTGPDGVIGVQ